MRRAISILPSGTAQVDMSSTIGGSFRPGKPIAMGFVPSIRSAPPRGATPRLLLVIDQPIMSRSSAFNT